MRLETLKVTHTPANAGGHTEYTTEHRVWDRERFIQARNDEQAKLREQGKDHYTLTFAAA